MERCTDAKPRYAAASRAVIHESDSDGGGTSIEINTRSSSSATSSLRSASRTACVSELVIRAAAKSRDGRVGAFGEQLADGSSPACSARTRRGPRSIAQEVGALYDDRPNTETDD